MNDNKNGDRSFISRNLWVLLAVALAVGAAQAQIHAKPSVPEAQQIAKQEAEDYAYEKIKGAVLEQRFITIEKQLAGIQLDLKRLTILVQKLER